MKILFVASEMFPVIKTGGLADVVGALPVALRASGVDVRVMMPAYPGTAAGLEDLAPWTAIGDPFGVGEARLALGFTPGARVPVWLVDCPRLYDRPGGIYVGPDGGDWPDNHLRFGLLARAAVMACRGDIDDAWRPDILHAHDWQAGLAPAYLALEEGPRPASVFTFHNLAFTGSFPPAVLASLGLPPESFAIDGAEFYGGLSFLKAGLFYADRLTTVSPTFARESMTTEGGFGFDGLMRLRAGELSGILNGIDADIWSPAADSLIPSRYDAASLARKDANRAALRARFGLAPVSGPVIGIVSRLTWQKGIDLLLAALPPLLAGGAQLVVLGTGEPASESAFRAAATVHAGAVGVVIGYDEGLAHLVQAGCDAFVMPSRFEPCGLTQMCALRYGTLPIVRRTGGLADTVIDADESRSGTGFVFDGASPEALAAAVRRAIAAFGDRRRWRTIQRRAMAQDFSWDRAARAYLDLYAGLPSRKEP